MFMCLRRLGHNLLQVSILQTICFILVSIAILRGTGKYQYKQIPKNEVMENLYWALSPGLRSDPALPNCEYGFVDSLEYIEREKVEHRILEFNSDGIDNGSYVPDDCNPAFSVAVLVTFRNRQQHLDKFIPYMHSFLKKQNIHYKIFVVEQGDSKPWNKGVLYNVGAQLALREGFPCLILHDVDLLPLNTANVYVCTHHPRHMSASIDKFRFVLLYEELVGGVTAITARDYKDVNGFSNKYEGWGAEDDDFARRIQNQNLHIVRFHPEVSRYTMLPHRPEKANERRYKMLRQTDGRHQQDGLNSLSYSSVIAHPRQLFVHVRVDL